MAARHWRLIVNGKSAESPALREAVRARRAAGRRIDVRVTWEQGDAARYAREAVEARVHCVIAAGGDGTLGEVAGALAAHADDANAAPALALLPLGTANDFATAAAIPSALDAALDLAAHGGLHAVDILRLRAGRQQRWCMNLASGGFGTQATVDVHEGVKRMLGGLSYVVRGIAAMRRIEPQHVRLRGPGYAWEGALIALGIGNARQAGAGQALCPDALIDDGRLDATIVPELGDETRRAIAAAVTGGTEVAIERYAERARLPWLELDAPEPFTLNLDGEPFEARRFRIDCLPGRLRMHLPTRCPLLGAPHRRSRHRAAADRTGRPESL